MKIEIHAKTDCPYCNMAKNHLTNHGLPYVESLYDEAEQRQMMYDQFGLSGDQRTVPQIVLVEDSGQTILIGGYTDLLESEVVARYVDDFETADDD